MKMRIAGIVNDSIVDGPGFRLAVFTQGCPHHCPGCHNPQTHDFDGGTEVDTREIIEKMGRNPLLDGVTLTGGEPFCHPKACAELAGAARKAGLNVWCYTGYTFETLLKEGTEEQRTLLRELDVLVDGPFLLARRTLNCRFRGSDNQRLILVRESLSQGRTIELVLPDA